MPYDEKDALSLLTNARATKFPQIYEMKRHAAAEKLIGAAIDVARKAGWTIGEGSPGRLSHPHLPAGLPAH
jgi:hypothetical protein